MGEDQSAVGGGERFFASKGGQAVRSRYVIWAAGLLGAVFGLAGAPGPLSGRIVAAAFVLLLVVAADWLVRRQYRPGQALVKLDGEGIESPLLPGRTKRYAWQDIEGLTVISGRGGQRLQLQLAGAAREQLRGRRNFWTGENLARPSFALSSFAPDVRERVFDAVNGYVQRGRLAQGEAPRPSINPLAEERQLRDRLRAFAPVAWVTWLLIGLNVLVWLWTVASGAGLEKTPADRLLAWGGNAASEVQRGQWWRLASALFLHSGFMHVAMNMLGLGLVGPMAERIYGHRQYLLIYMGAGLVGSALSLHFAAQQGVSVGASGAVFGVMGAVLTGVFQHRQRLPLAFSKPTLSGIGFFVVYALIQGFGGKGIDNAAHVGGLLGGCALAWVLPERFDPEQFRRTVARRAAAALALGLATVAALAVTAPPAAVDQARLPAGEAAFERGLGTFGAALKGLQREQDDLQAGRLAPWETVGRNKTELLPLFRRAHQDLAEAYVAPSDLRAGMLGDMRRMTDLMLEALEMPVVYRNGSITPEPMDPQRLAAIRAEFRTLDARLGREAKELNMAVNKH